MTPKQLQKYMKTLEWDNVKTAEMTGTTRSSISRYLNGKRPIPKIFCILIKIYVANGNKLE